MNFATVLLLTASLSTLVLRSGDRIAVEGPIQESDGVVLFHVPGGALYSIPQSEVDLDATAALEAAAEGQSQPDTKRLKVSAAERDRLLRELEQNHTGVAAPAPRYDAPSLQQASPQEVAAQTDEEWRWRNQARAYQERIRQAKENVALLLDEIDRLKSEISALLSLGFNSDTVGTRTLRVERLRAEVPYAEAEVVRAQRAYDEFKDEARRRGILPGWLR